VKKPYDRALIIGKFYPPHQGHNYLIETALNNCHKLAIIVCQRPEERPSGDIRLEYIKEIHGKSKSFHSIQLIDDIYDQDDSDLWAKLCINWLKPVFKGKKPLIQAVFTSEKYGDPFCFYLSKYMGKNVKHQVVDIERIKVPISGTRIRKEPLKYLNFMHRIVRNFYIKRVVLIGIDNEIAKKFSGLINALFLDCSNIEKPREISEYILKSGIYTDFKMIITNDDGLLRSLRSDNGNPPYYEYNDFIRHFHSFSYIISSQNLEILDKLKKETRSFDNIEIIELELFSEQDLLTVFSRIL
jgi:NadR type nicotinamide-nucleotide adenylyltransferase